MGGPNTCITNPRWWTAAILEKLKNHYLISPLTDRHEIWHSDAYWPSPPCQPLQFWIFKNPTWRTATILKIEKSRYLGDDITDRHQIWHDDAF